MRAALGIRPRYKVRETFASDGSTLLGLRCGQGWEAVQISTGMPGRRARVDGRIRPTVGSGAGGQGLSRIFAGLGDFKFWVSRGVNATRVGLA